MGSAGSPSSSLGSEDHKQGRKKAKAGGNSGAPTFEDLAQCFHLPAVEACAELGIGLAALKRTCRQFGLLRWPYRKRRTAAQGPALDSGTESEGYDEQPAKRHAKPSPRRLPDSPRSGVLQPVPQREHRTLASTFPTWPQLRAASSPARRSRPASPLVHSPSYTRGADAQQNGRSTVVQQSGQAGFLSVSAVQLPEPQPREMLTALPSLCSILQQELGRVTQPPEARQQQPHTAPLLGPVTTPPFPQLLVQQQPAPAQPAFDSAALLQLARQIVDVPGLARELASAIGAILVEKQDLHASR